MSLRTAIAVLTVFAASMYWLARSTANPAIEPANASPVSGPLSAVSQEGALKETVNGITYHMR